MTSPPLPLPGLDHLIAVLKKYGADVRLRPPSPTAPRAGDTLLGAPLDPFLAAVYSRFDGGRLGELDILETEPLPDSLFKLNEDLRNTKEPRIQKIVLYGTVFLLADYLATVPSLAGPDGIQPVLHVDLNELPFPYFLPIASNVDRAFDLYAYYADEQLKACGAFIANPHDGRDIIVFPDCVVSRIARDEKLIEMLSHGRFKEFTAPEPDSQAWVERILQVAGATH